MRSRGILAAALLLLTGCGETTGTGPASDTSLPWLEGLPPSYAEVRPTYAFEDTLHYGDRDIPTPVTKIEAVLRVPQGFFLGSGNDVVFFDGSTTTELPRIDDVAVSEDGRYAGWIDFSSSDVEDGYDTRLAQIVVVELTTGREVLRTSKGMGDEDDDLTDLYEDAEPAFLGFEDGAAFWNPASAPVDGYRYNLASGAIDAGLPRDDRFLDGYQYPVVSPGGTYVAEATSPKRLPIFTRSPKARADVAFGHPRVGFGSWVDNDTLFATGFGDGSRWLVQCELPAGTCADLVDLGDGFPVFDGWEPVRY